MPNKALFYGCGTALVTPFRDGQVDFDALERLIDWQIDSDIDALIVLGTTGEPPTLTAQERVEILECAIARAAGRVPIIAGTGSNDTAAAIRQSEEARRLGADAVLVVTPYYNRASREGLMAHYTAIADSVDCPVVMYNVPSRTGVNLEPAVVAELARHPNLCAVKEASGSLRQLTDLAAACEGGVAVYCGNDDQILPAMALGARGAISVASNVVPRPMKTLTELCLRGDVENARALQFALLPLMRALFSEVNPIPVKAALSMMGLIENELRLPLAPLDDEKTQRLEEALREWELPGEGR